MSYSKIPVKINSERLCQNLLVPFWSYTLELFQVRSCRISHMSEFNSYSSTKGFLEQLLEILRRWRRMFFKILSGVSKSVFSIVIFLYFQST